MFQIDAETDPGHEKLAESLATRGFAVCPLWLPDGLRAALLADLEAQEGAGRLIDAGVGRGAPEGGGVVEQAVRNDRTLWLSGRAPAAAEFMARMEALRQDLNRALFLGLFEYEAHYARYPAGGFYRKHIDALRGERNRVVSTVTYLTDGWTESDAGHLALYDQADHAREIARILPVGGTMVAFLSEEIPHEVLPPARPRCSIAGWFRCNASAAGRVDPGA